MRSATSMAMTLLAIASALVAVRDDVPGRVNRRTLALHRGGDTFACAQCWNDSSPSDCNRCTLYGGAAPAGTFAKCQSSEFNDGYFTHPSYTATQCERTSTGCSSTTLLLYYGGTCDAPHNATVAGGCAGRNYLNGTTMTASGQGCTGIMPGQFP